MPQSHRVESIVAAVVRRHANDGDGGYDLEDDLVSAARDLPATDQLALQYLMFDTVERRGAHWGVMCFALARLNLPGTAERLGEILLRWRQAEKSDPVAVGAVISALMELRYMPLLEVYIQETESRLASGDANELRRVAKFYLFDCERALDLSARWLPRFLLGPQAAALIGSVLYETFAWVFARVGPAVAVRCLQAIAEASPAAAAVFHRVLLRDLKSAGRFDPRKQGPADKVIRVLEDMTFDEADA